MKLSLLHKVYALVSRGYRLLFNKVESHDEVHATGLERIRRVILTGIAGMGATVLTSAVLLISVPLTIRYLGPVRYGVWVIINSMLTWLTISSMGLTGTALVNKLAEAQGHDNPLESRQLVSTAFFTLCGIAVLLAIIFALTYPLISWVDLVNARGEIDSSELGLAVILAASFFFLMFPVGVLDAVYFGFQEGYIINLWSVVASIFSLGAIIVVSFFHGSLPLLVCAMFGTRLLVSFISMFIAFNWLHPEVRPHWNYVTKKALKSLLSLGSKYMVQQIAGLGMFQIQPLLITRFLGPAQVGVYNLTQRLLTIPLMFVQLFSMPLVPAYGDARARSDWGWIAKTLRHSVIGAIGVTCIFIIPIAFALPFLFRWLMGADMMPSTLFVVLMVLYVLVNASITPIAVFFSGIQWMGSQAVIALISAIINIGLAIFMLKEYGLSGMGWAMFAGILANATGQMISIIIFKRGSKTSYGVV